MHAFVTSCEDELDVVEESGCVCKKRRAQVFKFLGLVVLYSLGVGNKKFVGCFDVRYDCGDKSLGEDLIGYWHTLGVVVFAFKLNSGGWKNSILLKFAYVSVNNFLEIGFASVGESAFESCQNNLDDAEHTVDLIGNYLSDALVLF